MATIRQLSTLNPVAELVLSQFETHAPIFSDINAYVRGGNADSLKKHRAGNQPGSTKIFRAVNAYTERSAPTIDYITVAKKIISGDSRVDKVYEQRNIDVVSELEFQTREDAKVDAKIFQEKAFLGDHGGADANEFDGLLTLVPVSRDVDLSAPMVLPVGGDASKAEQQHFFEHFIELQHVMPYDEFAAYMPEQLRLRMLTAAKNLGYYDAIQTPDGKIEKIGRAIIKGFGYKPNGDPMMPFNQTVDGHTKCSSILFAKWGEGTDLTFVTSAGMVADYLGIVDTKFYSNGWDLDGAFALQNDNALYLSTGYALESDGGGD